MDICIIQTRNNGSIVSTTRNRSREEIWTDHEDGQVPQYIFTNAFIIGEKYTFYFTNV